MKNFKPLSEAEGVEVVAYNMDNLPEVQQLKANNTDLETRLKNQGTTKKSAQILKITHFYQFFHYK